MTALYIAGRFSRRAELAEIANNLEGMGYVVTSTWLKVQDREGDHDEVPQGQKLGIAQRDLRDVRAADILVLDTFGGVNRGGREFEAGYALAAGKMFILVGPAVNVFHELADLAFATWEEAADSLEAAITGEFKAHDTAYDEVG